MPQRATAKGLEHGSTRIPTCAHSGAVKHYSQATRGFDSSSGKDSLTDVDRPFVFCSNSRMALLDLKIAPHTVLREKTTEVSTFDASLHQLLDDMYETMVVHNGIGLAAPQVGVSKSVAIIEVSGDYVEPPVIEPSANAAASDHIYNGRLELINPKITDGATKVSSEEGCLSIPEYRDSIIRHQKVTVQAQDREGRTFLLSAVELLAFAIQHEVDHLNGILFVDHLSRLKKTFFRKWALKNLGHADV